MNNIAIIDRISDWKVGDQFALQVENDFYCEACLFDALSACCFDNPSWFTKVKKAVKYNCREKVANYIRDYTKQKRCVAVHVDSHYTDEYVDVDKKYLCSLHLSAYLIWINEVNE